MQGEQDVVVFRNKDSRQGYQVEWLEQECRVHEGSDRYFQIENLVLARGLSG